MIGGDMPLNHLPVEEKGDTSLDKKTDVEGILAALRATERYNVEQVGYRYRITDKNGTLVPQFIVPSTAAVKQITNQLTNAGYNWDDVEVPVQAKANGKAEIPVQAPAKVEEYVKAKNETKARRDTKAAQDAAIEQFAAQIDEYDRLAGMEKLAAGAVKVGEVSFQVMELDAGWAADYLKHNDLWLPGVGGGTVEREVKRRSNRPVSWDWIIAMRDDMLRGNWILHHQGIALDKDGRLLDGQQRLLALVEADKVKPGIKIPMVVSYDWEAAVFDRIDVGRKRSLTDFLGLLGESQRLLYATSMRLAFHYDDDPLNNGWRTRVSDHELLEYAKRSELAARAGGYQTLRDCVEDGLKMARGAKMIASAAIAGLYVCQRAWPAGPHNQFVSGVQHGYIVVDDEGSRLPLGVKDARQALINWLGGVAGKKRGTGANVVHLAYYIAAWNNFILQRPSQVLKVTGMSMAPGGKMPTPLSGPEILGG